MIELPLLQVAIERLAEDSRVLLVYGFGSTFRDLAGPLSDVDIAILLESRIDLREELRLRARVVEVLRRDDVDLVILNRAPPLLRYEVVSTGVRLFTRSEPVAERFERRAFLEYCDTKRLRSVQRQLAREAAS